MEMLIALGITATLMSAVMVSLDASFKAYQRTTEVASTHTIGRLTMQRLMAMIRTGSDFAPFPLNPMDTIVESNTLESITPPRDPDDADDVGQHYLLTWDEDAESLSITISDPETGDIIADTILLDGVVPSLDDEGEQVAPFRLEFVKGRTLYRSTIDLTLEPDDDLSTSLDRGDTQIRLVASAMPRQVTY